MGIYDIVQFASYQTTQSYKNDWYKLFGLSMGPTIALLLFF